jgi:TctA family transporter
MIMLAGIYYGAMYGGSTTSILVNLPGETAAVVTCIDGYQMARQGRAGAALAIAAIGSFFAGTVCTLLIALFAPPLAEFALKFSSAEYFSLMLMGLVAAAVLAHGDMVKSLAMVVVGLLLGIVGADVNSGIKRFAFGFYELADGIGVVTIAVGVFAVGEILSNLSDPEERQVFTAKVTNLFPTKDDLKQSFGAIVRGTGVGAFFGVLPGTTPAIASFSSYMIEKKLANDPSRFGQGAIEGVAGPESANNADAQCKFYPDAHLGNSRKRDYGADARRADDLRHCARPAGDDRQARSFLGPNREHVDRQRDAGRAQLAADRHVGEPAQAALSAALPRYHGVLRDRHL